MDSERAKDLVNRYLNGVITERQQLELEEMLLSSESARGVYWDLADLHSLLRRLGEPSISEVRLGDRATETIAMASQFNRNHKMISVFALLATAASIFATVFTYWNWPASSGVVIASTVSAERTTDVVGILTRALDARWNPESYMPAVGEPLSPCRLQLEEGVAIIEFGCGASVLLEAPVDFELRSSDEAFCYSGRLNAKVPPPAIGFKIHTPNFEVIDRGTSFGLIVKDAGMTEVHVLEGLVEVKGSSIEGSQKVSQGKAFVGNADSILSTDANPTEFMSDEMFSIRMAASEMDRMKEWQEYGNRIREDPSVALWYSFDPNSLDDRTLQNQAFDSLPDSNGTIIGCQWTEGRWPGKRALDFKRSVDRVRLHIPGEFDSLTMMAWVRIDALPNTLNTLLHSDQRNSGGVVWEAANEGTIKFALAQNEVSPHDGHALGLVSRVNDMVRDTDFGQWLHLAVVVDTRNHTISHWRNGAMFQRTAFKSDRGIKIDSVEIGNWQPVASDIYPVRNFNGRMDEFVVFSRPLSSDEIATHYRHGMPAVSRPLPSQD